MTTTLSETPKRGDEVRVEVTSSAFEGKGIAKLDGFVIFVEGGIPGDVAIVQLQKTKKNFAEAKIRVLETPSPLRVTPRCEHVGVCGGCKWQHVAYETQLQFKQQHVEETFRHIGGFEQPPVLPIIGSEKTFFYRNKMEFSFSDKQWLVEKGDVEAAQKGIFAGLHVPQRYDKVLDINACYLQSEESNQILRTVREFARGSGLDVYSSDVNAGYWRFIVIRQAEHTKQLMVNIVTFEHKPDVMQQLTQKLLSVIPAITTVVNTINGRRAQIAVGEQEFLYHGNGMIQEKLGRFSFDISANSFFQTNTLQAERLYQVARDFADLKPTDVLWDLYSGTGTIGMFVSDAVSQVVGVESVESAISDAKRNAERNGVANCEFILGDLKDRLTKDKGWMETHPKPDVLIIDPPRSGMHPKVVEEIAAIAPERISYVSCNPATQARDVKMLCDSGYDLVALQPVDMFPHTFHIECVAKLRRR